MTDDERAIRSRIEKWMEASKASDIATVLGLMDDGVLFMVPGREPFGKDAFAAISQQMKDIRMEGNADVQEVKIAGDWAWTRVRLTVATMVENSLPVRRQGYTLSIWRKQANGAWAIYRDANLLSAE